MSRYRATTGELLEQIRQEGKMKDIYNMAFAGDKADTIAKKLKLDVDTVKKVLGERFSVSDFKSNEKDNKHSENAYELAKQFGTRQEVERMEQILKFIKQRGYVDKVGYDMGIKITKKYASKLEAYREVEEDWKDTNKRNVEKHGSTGKTKDEDRVKSLENEIQRLKLELENEKNATVKPEPNPDTGEVPLTVGVAHKYLKDKQDKKEVKKEELEEVFSRSQIDKLKKQYEPLRNKRINPTNLMKVFDKIDHDKNTLIQLYKSDIPFVSTLAGSRLSQKHNLSPRDIKSIISKVPASMFSKEEVELTEYFATVHSDKKPIADFIKKNKSGIDYVDDDAGGNIEFEGKGAHELADKVKAKFGVRVTKESFEPIEDKSLSLDENKHTLPSMRVPMTVQYTYGRNPISFMQTLTGTKAGKKLRTVFPLKKGSGVYTLKGTGEDHIDFLKVLNSKGIMPKNKIIGEELEEDTNKYITEKIKGLENKAKKTGMPYGILKKVYDRGMAAWKGGHRPGATQQQWAFARVNSFVTKSSGTWGKADKDLAQKVRAAESVEESRQLKDKEKEMMVVKNGKVIVIDKSDFDKYKSKGYIQAEDIENEACWDSHKQVGFKMKGGKRVPNCVPKNEELEESTKVEGGPPARDDSGKMGPGSGAHNHGKSSSTPKELTTKDGKPSAAKLKGIIQYKIRSQSGAGDDLGFIEYKYKGKDTLEMDADEPDELVKVLKKKFGNALDIKAKYNIVTAKIKESIDEKYYPLPKLTPAQKNAQKKFQDLLKKLDKDRQAKKAAYLKTEKEEVQEADLTDKQVDMVKKVADKLPKDDFKKRYGKDADNVKFGTATNIVKKKLNIDGYEGARNLVDRLLKQEKGDE